MSEAKILGNVEWWAYSGAVWGLHLTARHMINLAHLSYNKITNKSWVKVGKLG